MNAFLLPGDNSYQQRAYSHIKEGILGFQLRPNQRLVASELAAELGISRTPVREALSRLEQEVLVMRTGGWGYLVRGMNLKDVQELFKVREVLEVAAVIEAIVNIEPTIIEKLANILEKAAGSKRNRAKFVTLNRNFHNIIAVAARNDLLLHMLGVIGDRVQLIGSMTVHQDPQRMDGVLEENHAILRAIEKRDGAAAKASVRAHIRLGREHALRILEHGAERFAFASMTEAAPMRLPATRTQR